MTDADEVDRIVDDWERERPDLDFAPLQVLSRVARLSKHLDRARREAFARSELEASEFDVLSALRRAGAPYRLSPKQLLQQTLVSSGTMTNRIDRLVERGLVSRQTDPNDGRGILVEMTAGRADPGRCRDHPTRRRRVGAAAQPAGGRAEAARRPAAQAEPRVRLTSRPRLAVPASIRRRSARFLADDGRSAPDRARLAIGDPPTGAAPCARASCRRTARPARTAR